MTLSGPVTVTDNNVTGTPAYEGGDANDNDKLDVGRNLDLYRRA